MFCKSERQKVVQYTYSKKDCKSFFRGGAQSYMQPCVRRDNFAEKKLAQPFHCEKGSYSWKLERVHNTGGEDPKRIGESRRRKRETEREKED